MSLKLNQIVAIEKSVKSRVERALTDIHHVNQKAGLFNGFAKTYRPLDEEGETYPPESQKVQFQVGEMLDGAAMLLTDLFNVEFAKDSANCRALADVAINDKVIIKDAPVSFLLFMEKQVNDVRKFIDELPTLDNSEDWQKDENSGLFKTAATATHRTKKVQRPLLMSPATPEHPAQTQLIVEDVLVGHWSTVKHSGAIPAPRKKQLLERVDALGKAIKQAREQANMADATMSDVGKAIFEYILS